MEATHFKKSDNWNEHGLFTATMCTLLYVCRIFRKEFIQCCPRRQIGTLKLLRVHFALLPPPIHVFFPFLTPLAVSSPFQSRGAFFPVSIYSLHWVGEMVLVIVFGPDLSSKSGTNQVLLLQDHQESKSRRRAQRQNRNCTGFAAQYQAVNVFQCVSASLLYLGRDTLFQGSYWSECSRTTSCTLKISFHFISNPIMMLSEPFRWFNTSFLQILALPALYHYLSVDFTKRSSFRPNV